MARVGVPLAGGDIARRHSGPALSLAPFAGLAHEITERAGCKRVPAPHCGKEPSGRNGRLQDEVPAA